MGMGWTRPLTPEEEAARDAEAQRAAGEFGTFLATPIPQLGVPKPPVDRSKLGPYTEEAPETPLNLDNPLGLPPMRLPGAPGSLGQPAAADAPHAPPKPSGGYRAVRMPDGSITFTNLGAAAGGEVLDEDTTRREAAAEGATLSPRPSQARRAPLPETIGAEGDPSYRRLFARDNNLADVQSRDLVERAAAAQRAGRTGSFSAEELKPGDDGGTTPGYEHLRDQQTESTLGELERRSALGEARSRAAWAQLSPEDRLRAEAAYKAAERPNFNLQIIEHLQSQMADINKRARQVDAQVEAKFPNADNPATARLRQEYRANLMSALDAEREQILKIGGLPFKSDPYGLLSVGGDQTGGAVTQR